MKDTPEASAQISVSEPKRRSAFPAAVVGVQSLVLVGTKILSLLQLGRINLSPLTASVPILGAYTLLEDISVGEVFLLGTLGFCAHLFGFALNDIVDYPIDSNLNFRQKHPLIIGRITHREAWIFALLQLPVAFFIYIFLLGGSLTGIILLSLSVVLSIIYNLWSKRGNFSRFLTELSLALSIGLLALCGTLSKTTFIPSASLEFSISLSLILLLVNSVSSGLKDLKSDADFNGRSFARSTGSLVIGEDRLYISPYLKRYSFILELLVVLSFVFLANAYSLDWPSVVLIIALTIYGGLHLGMILTMNSFRALRRSGPLINGYYNYLALCMVVAPWLPAGLKGFLGLLTFLALIWPWYVGYRGWRGRLSNKR